MTSDQETYSNPGIVALRGATLSRPPDSLTNTPDLEESVSVTTAAREIIIHRILLGENGYISTPRHRCIGGPAGDALGKRLVLIVPQFLAALVSND